MQRNTSQPGWWPTSWPHLPFDPSPYVESSSHLTLHLWWEYLLTFTPPPPLFVQVSFSNTPNFFIVHIFFSLCLSTLLSNITDSFIFSKLRTKKTNFRNFANCPYFVLNLLIEIYCNYLIYCREPAISLHSHHVSLVQWTTCLLPDPGCQDAQPVFAGAWLVAQIAGDSFFYRLCLSWFLAQAGELHSAFPCRECITEGMDVGCWRLCLFAPGPLAAHMLWICRCNIWLRFLLVGSTDIQSSTHIRIIGATWFPSFHISHSWGQASFAIWMLCYLSRLFC